MLDLTEIKGLIERIDALDLEEKVAAINDVRAMLHTISPFKTEPVDFVKWVRADKISANEYNPNSVAPPEMKLLERSIKEDGYTQLLQRVFNDLRQRRKHTTASLEFYRDTRPYSIGSRSRSVGTNSIFVYTFGDEVEMSDAKSIVAMMAVLAATAGDKPWLTLTSSKAKGPKPPFTDEQLAKLEACEGKEKRNLVKQFRAEWIAKGRKP